MKTTVANNGGFDDLDQDLQHVLLEFGIEETSSTIPRILLQSGIRRFCQLASPLSVELLREGAITIPKVHRDQLLNTVDWFHHRLRQTSDAGGCVSVTQDFSREIYEHYLAQKHSTTSSAPLQVKRKRPRKKMSEAARELYVKMLLKNPELQTEEILAVAGLEASDLDPVHRVLTSMTPTLKRACNFDYKSLIEDAVEAFQKGPDGCNTDFLVYGPTQSGKSGVKGVLRHVGLVLQCPVFIITKGCQEAENLCDKLKGYARGTELEANIQTAFGGRRRYENGGSTLVMTDGGTLIAADTAAQVGLLNTAIEQYRGNDPERKFILVVDECDSLYRTEEKSQLVEWAFWEVMDQRPTLVYKISATLVPVLLHYKLQDDIPDIKMYQIEPGEDYLRLDQMKAPVKNQKEQYLTRKDLNRSFGYRYKVPDVEEEVEDFIPFTNDAVMGVYFDALRPNALLLDVTCHLVDRRNQGSIFEKAEKVQEVMQLERNYGVALIVVVGRGIFVKYPPQGTSNMNERKSKHSGGEPRMKYFEGTLVQKVRTSLAILVCLAENG